MNAPSAPAGVIRGTVRDAAGAPVAGARVAFADGPVPLPDVAAVTDSEGRFALTAPAEGTYTLLCRADGGTATARVHVTAAPAARPEDVRADLRLG
ncbi:carboxypeptidase regulatory-like domain-containing protein [Streptomyces rectiverticillatus]|uniref:carboxypeptidase-like regulatory domain-containing protein n=1 Tax=Streptomyces rectiverticillatus TaxID=173860 RepID=UPI0015C3D0D4|nr:carboxypeptidase-like regulatory domain-containing protein [Streptomyces rectiverticillatus]QLE72090.1 carboxypeptidase regulatory-like domain-containing protein [Streptomyces rectiverticillatus]